MAKLHARPSNQYRYEHYDPWSGASARRRGDQSPSLGIDHRSAKSTMLPALCAGSIADVTMM